MNQEEIKDKLKKFGIEIGKYGVWVKHYSESEDEVEVTIDGPITIKKERGKEVERD